MPSPAEDPLEKMFAHKSKMAKLISQKTLNTYKELLFMLRRMQKTGELPVHQENAYLGDNVLAKDIYLRKYFVKDLDGKPIETRPEDVFTRLAAFMACVEETEEKRFSYAVKFYRHLYDGHFLPGGRVIAGAGDLYRLKTLANCFVSMIEADNMEAIYKAAYECARTYSYGGGIGVDMTTLRPRNSVVHNASDFSTGSVSFMELYSLTTGLIGQSGRRGALMLTLDVKHPDAINFIKIKQDPNWVTRQIVDQCSWSGIFDKTQLAEVERQVRENTQVRFANVSLKVCDEFMNSVEEQIKYSPNTILVYRRTKDDTPEKTKQGEIQYSIGVPSKNLANYQLIFKAETIGDLNLFLKEYGKSITEEELKNVGKRTVFGDYIVNTADGKDLAIHYAGDFILYFNSDPTGEIKKLVKGRDVWHQFVASNYKTAEPGLIFWSRMSKYSPTNYVGRPIISTNPCVAADSLVPTENGLERIDSIQAENIIVDSRTETANGLLQYGCKSVKPLQRLMTGYKDCYTLETKSGYEVTATPDHRILTKEGWKELKDITENDSVLIQSGEGKFNKSCKLPFDVQNRIVGNNGREYNLNLPSEWNRDLGLLLGWLTGDGFISTSHNKVGLVFAKEDEEARQKIQPIFENYCNGRITKLRHFNGCLQIRSGSKYIADFFRKLGVKNSNCEREVPLTLFTATEEAVLGFLEGLLSSDGTIALGTESRNYVRLNSSSLKLLKQVQLLLLNFGMKSTIYDRSTKSKIFRYTNTKGEIIKYKTSGINYELNISKQNVAKLIKRIVFLQTKNKNKVSELRAFEFYKETFVDKVKAKKFAGVKEVWDITEPETHSFIANGIVVHNCGEIPLQDGGACNLGSINLSRFVNASYSPEAEIDWERLRTTVHEFTRFLDNTITWNEQLNPLEKQRVATGETRRLGLGVMGIADMLNELGIGYDSDEALRLMERVMKFIANESYRASAVLAKEKSPAPLWDYEKYSKGPFFSEAITEDVKDLVKENGLRNLALLTIAPTGTLSNVVLGFVHGKKHYAGVSSGVEPVFALYYRRRSETLNREQSSKFYTVFHPTVEGYVEMMGLKDALVDIEDLDEMRKVLPEHFFRTAHFIDPMKRVEIQGICQKYIDHSISSTVNLPESIKPDTVSQIYFEAWKKGLKGITIYRDGSRYPILSVATQQSEFQKMKSKPFKVVTGSGELLVKGDEVFTMDDGSLTTVFHSLENNHPIEIIHLDPVTLEPVGSNLEKFMVPQKQSGATDSGVCKIELKDGKVVKTCEE